MGHKHWAIINSFNSSSEIVWSQFSNCDQSVVLTCAFLVQLGLSFLLDLLNDSLVILLQKHKHKEGVGCSNEMKTANNSLPMWQLHQHDNSRTTFINNTIHTTTICFREMPLLMSEVICDVMFPWRHQTASTSVRNLGLPQAAPADQSQSS